MISNERTYERLIGSYTTGAPGPLFIVVGGLHGNEPSGVLASRRVIAELESRRIPFRGKLVCFGGNLAALTRGARYVDRDLNRVWTDERLARLGEDVVLGEDSEAGEQRELLECIEGAIAERDWEQVVMMDLHSTSAGGAPFSIMADTIQNRRVAFGLPIPVILGLEERVAGTLLAYFAERGHVALCVEGGQNELASTVDHHEAALWITLVSAGAVDENEVPELGVRRVLLESTSWGLPRVVEVRIRFPIPEGGRFEMEPGYANFDHVVAGERLAHVGTELETAVDAPESGLLLMPRYQGQGHDGFFLGREVRRVWLKLSATLRRYRLERLLPLLPGVRREEDARMLSVNPRIARAFLVEIFHLFGYRWARTSAGRLIFVRRPDRF